MASKIHTIESHEAEMPDCDDPDCEFHTWQEDYDLEAKTVILFNRKKNMSLAFGDEGVDITNMDGQLLRQLTYEELRHA